MPIPRKSPLKKDAKVDDHEDSEGENAEAEPEIVDVEEESVPKGLEKDTALIFLQDKNDSHNSSQSITLSVPKLSLTDSNGKKDGPKSTSGSVQGSDQAFETPKESEDESSSESKESGSDDDDDESVAEKKGRSNQSTGKRTRGRKRDVSESENESVAEKKRKRTGGRKRAARESDDESVETRKSGRTPKPVTPFQIKEKLNAKGTNEDDTESMFSEVDEPLIKHIQKNKQKTKRGRGRPPGSGKTLAVNAEKSKRGRGRPRCKASYESGESAESDEESIVLVKPKPGPKSTKQEAEFKSKPIAKKTKQDESKPTNGALSSKQPVMKNLAVDCGVRIEPTTDTVLLNPISSSPRKPAVASTSRAAYRNCASTLDEDSEYINLKKLLISKQIELADHEIYCRKLESLRRERELRLGISAYTRELVETHEKRVYKK